MYVRRVNPIKSKDWDTHEYRNEVRRLSDARSNSNATATA